MRLLVVAVLALVVPAVASADIGIRRVEPTTGHPGTAIRVTVTGFLGARPWPAMPVVIVHAARAPQPRRCGANALCGPALYARELDRPPYRRLGSVRRWRPIGRSDVSAVGTLRARVPRLAPGRYVLGLFCASCTRGPKGSLIVNDRLVITVR